MNITVMAVFEIIWRRTGHWRKNIKYRVETAVI